jgi:hypothetical protein
MRGHTVTSTLFTAMSVSVISYIRYCERERLHTCITHTLALDKTGRSVNGKTFVFCACHEETMRTMHRCHRKRLLYGAMFNFE